MSLKMSMNKPSKPIEEPDQVYAIPMYTPRDNNEPSLPNMVHIKIDEEFSKDVSISNEQKPPPCQVTMKKLKIKEKHPSVALHNEQLEKTIMINLNTINQEQAQSYEEAKKQFKVRHFEPASERSRDKGSDSRGTMVIKRRHIKFKPEKIQELNSGSKLAKSNHKKLKISKSSAKIVNSKQINTNSIPQLQIMPSSKEPVINIESPIKIKSHLL